MNDKVVYLHLICIFQYKMADLDGAEGDLSHSAGH